MFIKFSKFALLVLVLFSSLSIMPKPTYAASATVIEKRSANTLRNFKSKIKGADEVLSKARGILIMPAIYQGGIGVGGKYGEGALKINNKTYAYYNVVGASYGFQLGAQKKSLIIAFMDEDSLDKFKASNGFEFGVDASAAVITVGADGNFNQNDLMNKPIVAFAVDQKGLMYNLSLAGSKFTKINR